MSGYMTPEEYEINPQTIAEREASKVAERIAAKDATIAALQREIEGLKAVAADAALLMSKIDDIDPAQDGAETDRVYARYEFDSLRRSLDHVRNERSAYFDVALEARTRAENAEIRATTAERQLEEYQEAVRVLGNLVWCIREGVKNKTFIEHMDDRKMYDSCVDCNPLASAAVRGPQQPSGTEKGGAT